MQAIKHSSSAKKCTNNSKGSSGSSKTTSDCTSNKSIAQRVMDVASNNITQTNGNNNVVTSGSGSTGTTKPILKSSSSSNNSVENDQEVEDITSRAAKLEVGASNSSTNNQQLKTNGSITNNDVNNNNNNNNNSTNQNQKCLVLSGSAKQSNSSSPNLLFDDSTLLAKNSSNTETNRSNNAHTFNSSSTPFSLSSGLVSCESVFRQVVIKNITPQTTNTNNGTSIGEEQTKKNTETTKHGTSNLSIEETRISLDTKVPHPSKNDFHQREQEEVSYYNDQVTSSLLEPRAGGSLDNSTRPKLLAASKEQKLGVFMPKTATSCQQLQQKHGKTQLCRQSSSREYLNDVVEDYDDYDGRYDNAMVEKKTRKQFLDNPDDNNQLVGAMSIPTSPKAKSAPATPCNVTPTAFHQHTSHLNSLLNPNPANTLPPDIRKNISATCRVLPSSIGIQGQTTTTVSTQYLDELIKRGEIAFESKDYLGAIHSFSQCIELAKNNLPENQNIVYLKKNFKVYSQRAEAHFNLCNYNEAIEDSMAARDLNPKWTQAYYLQGQSQFLIGQYADSLAVFSFGLAQDPSNRRLFNVLVDSALKSSFKQDFEPKYKKLKSLDYDKKPFVVVSVLGQELLAKGHGEHAAIILESALKMGADNKKFKGSVLSTIALAYCLMKDYEKAATYMQKELEVENELEDANGQCKVLSNLGYTYYKLRKFDKSLEAHRKQLNLAMKTHLFQQASVALNALGHVHAARNDYLNALTSHTRCLDILKQLGDNHYSQYKELLSIGHIHSMLGDFKAAEEKYNEAIPLLRQGSNGKISPEEYQVGLIMVKFNLAYLALKKQSFHEAAQYYSEIMDLAQKIPNPRRSLYEMRAANGMGQAHRLFKDFNEARRWFEKQLQLAQSIEDQVGQSQALCNLGMTYQHFRDYNNAWRLFDENMKLVEKNPLLKAYAHSYIGSMYFLTGRYNEAQAHYENSSNLFRDLDYCSAERKTIDLNMAFVHERMGHSELNTPSTHQKKVMMAS